MDADRTPSAARDRSFEVVHDDGETLRVVPWEDYEQVQARFGVLLSFARPADIQAAERHIVKYGLLDSDGNPLPLDEEVDLDAQTI